MFQAKDNVSIDRLHRFRSTPPQNTLNNESSVMCETLSIDDWVIFKDLSYVCHILHFKNMNKRTKRESSNKNQIIELTEENKMNVGVMCNFFRCTMNNDICELKLPDCQPFVIPLNNFIAKLSKPFNGDDSKLFYDDPEEIQLIMSNLIL